VPQAARLGRRIERVPLDERLGLPEGEISYVLEGRTDAAAGGVQGAVGAAELAADVAVAIGNGTGVAGRVGTLLVMEDILGHYSPAEIHQLAGLIVADFEPP
jgi:hypothetical protein